MAEPTQQPKRRVPLGKPLALTDNLLDQMAQVTPADIEKAKELWRNSAPPEFADLLDAETVDEEETE